MLLLIFTAIYNHSSPLQFNHENTLYHNYGVDKVKEEYQDKYWGRICREGKGPRHGGKNKGENNQECEEIGGGMCPVFCREEEVCISNLRLTEERY